MRALQNETHMRGSILDTNRAGRYWGVIGQDPNTALPLCMTRLRTQEKVVLSRRRLLINMRNGVKLSYY